MKLLNMYINYYKFEHWHEIYTCFRRENSRLFRVKLVFFSLCETGEPLKHREIGKCPNIKGRAIIVFMNRGLHVKGKGYKPTSSWFIHLLGRDFKCFPAVR